MMAIVNVGVLSNLQKFQVAHISLAKDSSFLSVHSGRSVVLRLFQQSWFTQWPFLHYDESNDLAYCHTCVMGFKQKKMRAAKADPAFVSAAVIVAGVLGF